MADEQTENSAARAELNRQMRLAMERFDASETETDAWTFLCECGDGGCQEWIELPLAAYEARRRREEPILAPGHTLSRAQSSRRRARHLAEDADALRAQAQQQVKRAARNRKPRDR